MDFLLLLLLWATALTNRTENREWNHEDSPLPLARPPPGPNSDAEKEVMEEKQIESRDSSK